MDKWYSAVLVTSVIGVLTGGCALIASPHGTQWPPPNIDVRQLQTATLLRLYDRSDLQFEREIIGINHPRVATAAGEELQHRLEARGLSEEETGRFITSLRRELKEELRSGRFAVNAPLWDCAAKYDIDYVADLIWQERRSLPNGSTTAVRILMLAGEEARAYDLLRGQLESWHEGTVCGALAVIGEIKLKTAADAVFKRTHAARWLIRMAALQALDRLDDPRARQALSEHLDDIARSSVGHRVLWLPSAMAATMAMEYTRAELAKAIARRNVPGAPDVLEAMMLRDAGAYSLAPRLAAGESLMRINRAKGLDAIRTLLRRDNERDQAIGAEIAEDSKATELADDLEAVKRTSRYSRSRDRASQALSILKRSEAVR